MEDIITEKRKKSTGPSADAVLKRTKNMKPAFKPPPGNLVDTSSSSDDESLAPVKRTKKKTPQKKSPTVENILPQKSNKTMAQPDVDVLKKTKDTTTHSKYSTAGLFEDSDASDDANVDHLMTTGDDSNPSPITLSRCNKEDKRKTFFYYGK